MRVFSFENKRSWLELAYRVVLTVAAYTALPFLPRQAPRAGCAWRKRTMDKPTEDQIRQRAHELWEQKAQSHFAAITTACLTGGQ